MDSRIFIQKATALIKEIKDFKDSGTGVGQDSVLQREITAAFSSLQNPTLPTAEKLLDAALDAGFTVNPQVQNRIRSAMSVWAQA